MSGRTLVVNIQKGSGLKDVDFGKGCSDPYVVVKHDGKALGKTKVVKNNLNPVFNHTLAVPVVGSGVSGEIVFEIFDKDLLSKDDPMGHVSINLEDVAKAGPDGLSSKKIVRPDKDGQNVSGTLDLQIKFVDEFQGKLSSGKVDLSGGV